MKLLFGTLLLLASSAAAGLYPTRPIASTVFSAGRLSTITWINDDTQPSVSQMGPIRIDLYSGDNDYVATLAQNVEPTKRSKSVWISPTLGSNGSDYHLRFICEDPQITVYTARFTLTAMDDTPPYHRADKVEPRSTTYSAFAVGNDATSTFSSFSAIPTSLNTSATSTYSSGMSSSTLSSSYYLPASTGDAYRRQHHSSTGTSGSWKRNTMDVERLKFRLVFILWPLLVGVTMAL
ncbi:hypothetical protein EVJ58_g3993 [Rhodofomes roseus]|uniref:Yeast cell wall synthesis Kre9/Knh1-like N-terminal domain-containing protein n=1 Tax=Rhodofomes roseus TaxID=34475 RepID=A0A4Y9YI64_9APHY|nr:hypothetical protein EVJ58_g3993 [Rhodofomes roseus]